MEPPFLVIDARRRGRIRSLCSRKQIFEERNRRNRLGSERCASHGIHILGQHLRGGEVAHVRGLIHEVGRLGVVQLFERVASETADVSDFKGKAAGQLPLNGEIDDLRVRRLYLVVRRFRDRKPEWSVVNGYATAEGGTG